MLFSAICGIEVFAVFQMCQGFSSETIGDCDLLDKKLTMTC